MRPISIESVLDLKDVADAFLIDQFGTIHDGEGPYPQAADALRELRRAGKKVILLSNSGRRSIDNLQRLRKIGFAPDCFDASVCSGEVAWQSLRGEPLLCLKRHCRVLLLARSRSLDILEGFDVELVERADEADLVVIAGSEVDQVGYQVLWQRMRPAAEKGVPAICTNPDRIMIANGRLHPGAGALAQAYVESGGSVRFFGKPHADVYQAAFDLIPTVARSRVVGVGDSIEHDIAGAAAQGCQTLLIRGGILATLESEQLQKEMRRIGYRPSYIAPLFAPSAEPIYDKR